VAFSESGPTHPCIVCGSPDQVCTVPTLTVPPDDIEISVSPGGVLTDYEIDGRWYRLNEDDARFRGLIP